jgi:hypothetical protein
MPVVVVVPLLTGLPLYEKESLEFSSPALHLMDATLSGYPLFP